MSEYRATYARICTKCGGKISIGDLVVRAAFSETVHAQCPTDEEPT